MPVPFNRFHHSWADVSAFIFRQSLYCSKGVTTFTDLNISEDQYGHEVPGGVKPFCLRVKVGRVTDSSSLAVTTCSTSSSA